MKGDEDELAGIRRSWSSRLLSTGRIAATAGRLAARRLVRAQGAGDGALGEALARELDQMKGMAMKVGQILSYLDGALPEETHAALRSLQQGTRPVAFTEMRAVIERSLGQPLDDLFEEFGSSPVAAASIGQVYRARHAGQPVAVKVQYPGIAETIEGDFARLGRLASLASLATAVDGPALVAELRERFVEECDYGQEARHQVAFARAFADDPAVQVPGVIRERSGPGVLTTEWVDGRDFYAFEGEAPPGQRTAAGLIMTRFAYRSLFNLLALNADPHPGNYLFAHDASIAGPVVTFLDFGCVRRFDPAFVEAQRELTRVVLSERRTAFPEALRAAGMVGDPARFDYDVHWDMLGHQHLPYMSPRFRFTPDYVRESMEFGRPSNPNLRRMAIPPASIWILMLQTGLHAVLARLQAHGDFGSILREALEAPVTPLAVVPVDP